MKDYFEKVNFKKKSADDKKDAKLTACKEKLNTYKPSVLFVGRRPTAQTQIRRRRMRRLIRVSTVCLQKVILNSNKKCKIPANNS